MDERTPRTAPSAALRLSNNRLAESAARYRFDLVRVPFSCECGDPACHVTVPMSLSDYRGVGPTGDALLAPSHLVYAEDVR